MNAEDQELYERLKQKYSGVGAAGVPVDPNAPEAASWQPPQVEAAACSTATGVCLRSGAGPDVKMCPVCQGAGTQVEIYNHRRLEKLCTSCSGRGVRVYKDGVEVVEGQSGGSGAAGTGQGSTSSSSNSSSDAGVAEQHTGVGSVTAWSSKPAWARSSRERIGKVEEDLQKIETALQGYQQELGAVGSGSKGVTDAEELSLRQELAKQLQSHISRLQQLQGKKQAELQRLRKPTTIDDIIENEGVPREFTTTIVS